jgi:hypothetical protein
MSSSYGRARGKVQGAGMLAWYLERRRAVMSVEAWAPPIQFKRQECGQQAPPR